MDAVEAPCPGRNSASTRRKHPAHMSLARVSGSGSRAPRARPLTITAAARPPALSSPAARPAAPPPLPVCPELGRGRVPLHVSAASSCWSASVTGSLESSESCFSQQPQTLGHHRDFIPGRKESTGQGEAKGRVGRARPRAQGKTPGGPSAHTYTIPPKVRVPQGTQAGTRPESQSGACGSPAPPAGGRCLSDAVTGQTSDTLDAGTALPRGASPGGRGAGPWRPGRARAPQGQQGRPSRKAGASL